MHVPGHVTARALAPSGRMASAGNMAEEEPNVPMGEPVDDAAPETAEAAAQSR